MKIIMNQFMDIVLISGFKLIVLIGFVLLIKSWIRKNKNITPVLVYWILGLYFVLIMSSQIAELYLMQFYYTQNHLTSDADSISSISSMIGLIIYILIGVKYIRGKKIPIHEENQKEKKINSVFTAVNSKDTPANVSKLNFIMSLLISLFISFSGYAFLNESMIIDNFQESENIKNIILTLLFVSSFIFFTIMKSSRKKQKNQ
jgi:hypothetical protein